MLKAILDSLEGLDENQANLYAEQDGKFYLQVEPVDGYALENVQGLKSSLQKERTSAKALLKKLNAFDGLDAIEAKEAMEQLQIGNTKNAEETKAQIDALKSQLSAKHAKEIETLNSSLSSMREQMSHELIKSKALESLAKHGGNAELLMPHIMTQTKLEELDGKFSAVVIDTNGDTRISSATNSMDNMTIEELVEQMRNSDTFAPAFSGSGATGSGAFGSTATGSGTASRTLSWEEAHNPETYRQAKQQAEKAGRELDVKSFGEA